MRWTRVWTGETTSFSAKEKEKYLDTTLHVFSPQLKLCCLSNGVSHATIKAQLATCTDTAVRVLLPCAGRCALLDCINL